MKEFILKVSKIQQELKAPKNQFNRFGGYKYRSCEDILEAVKPLLGDMVLTINDEIVEVGGRIYVKAKATITDGINKIENTAFAREAESKKGMDESQITGSTSSYARKYALNGLLCIDDTKDADATSTHGAESEKTPAEKAKETRERNKVSFEDRFLKMYKYFKSNPVWSYEMEERFNNVIEEAKKRKYDEEKTKEMIDIFNGLEKDSLPSFEVGVNENV